MKTLQRTIAFAIVAGCCFAWSKSAGAEQPSACMASATHIAKSLNWQVSPGSADRVIGSIPQLRQARIELVCPRREERALLATFSYSAEYPPELFYEQLGAAVEMLTGVSGQRVRLQAHRCHRAAKRAEGRAHKNAKPTRIDCLRMPGISVFWVRREGRHQQQSQVRTDKTAPAPVFRRGMQPSVAPTAINWKRHGTPMTRCPASRTRMTRPVAKATSDRMT